ncbi:MAG: D-amino acid dehydrogenase [Gammaproteobacteria bacterium]
MKCAVIGGGLLGLTTAWFLRQSGCAVTVYERREGIGLETSFANGGMLHASQASPWNEPGVVWQALRNLGHEDAALLIRPRVVPSMLGWTWSFFRNSTRRKFDQNLEKNTRLADYSLSVLNEHLDAVVPDFLRQDRGTLKIYRSQPDFENAVAIAARGADSGIEYAALDSAGVVALEPALAAIGDEIVGGVHFPGDVSGDAHLFCRGLAERFIEAGGKIELNTTLQGIEVEANEVRGIRTASEVLPTDSCIIAAGSYSGALARTCGIAVPVQPVKGYSLTLPMDTWSPRPTVPVIDEHFHAAVCPLGDRMRVAGTAEFAGFDATLSPGRIANLLRLVKHVFPQSAASLGPDDVVQWSGFRPMTPDGVGVMGATPVRGLFVNAGHGHLGWTMAPAAGKLVADLICQRAPEIDLEPYSLSRFDRN